MKSMNKNEIFNFTELFSSEFQVLGAIKIIRAGEINARPGYEVDWHINNCYEIIYIISGEGYFHSGDEKYHLREKDLQIIKKGTRHYISTIEGHNLWYCFIAFDFVEPIEEKYVQFKKMLENNDSLVLPDFSSIFRIFTMIIDETYFHRIFERDVLSSLLEITLIYIYRRISGIRCRTIPHEKTGTSKHLIYSIIRLIEENAESITCVKDIANTTNYSCSYMAHIFKQEMGISLQAYIIEKRMQRAADMLVDQQIPVSCVAQYFGYQSVQSFSKTFKKIMSLSPTEYAKYRKKYQSGLHI